MDRTPLFPHLFHIISIKSLRNHLIPAFLSLFPKIMCNVLGSVHLCLTPVELSCADGETGLQLCNSIEDFTECAVTFGSACQWNSNSTVRSRANGVHFRVQGICSKPHACANKLQRKCGEQFVSQENPICSYDQVRAEIIPIPCLHADLLSHELVQPREPIFMFGVYGRK